MTSLRFLLFQVRKPDDPMRPQEVACFAEALGTKMDSITAVDLIHFKLDDQLLQDYDAIFVGGSGHFSVVRGGPWLDGSLNVIRQAAESGKPMFASCWGFQAMARALGGEVVHRGELAELGTMDIRLTEAGREDPVFGFAEANFPGHSGHEDTVVRLPANAIRLASSERVENQAYKLVDLPVYATQFHPELRLEHYFQRLRAYPRYVAEITGLSPEEFEARCTETHQSNALLRQFIGHVVLG